MNTSTKKPPKEITSCPEGSCLVHAHDKKKKNKRGEPYIQHVHNYCRMIPNYFDNFCKTENPENPDLTYAMLTTFGEARGEPNESIKAIAWVIRNRKQIKKWKGTYKSIVLSKSQFDCWDPSDKNYLAILRIIHHDKKEQEIWEKCKKLTEEVHHTSEDNNPLPLVYNYFSGPPKYDWQKDYFDLPTIPRFHFVKLANP